MGYNWQPSQKFKGVRFHQHESRKHGVKFDRLYGIRYQLGGKRYEHVLGWISEGWTEEKVGLELADIKLQYKKGEKIVSLKDKRVEAKRKKEEEEVKQVTFSSFWEQSYWPAQSYKSAGSLGAESSLYKHWICPQIGKTQLIRLEPKNVEKVSSAMFAKNRNPASVKYALAVISQVWNLAKRDGLVIGDSPTQKIKLPKKDNARVRFLTKNEANELLEELQIRSPLTHDIAILALYCGLRFGEIASLTWQDIDFENEDIYIRDPKAGVNRKAFFINQVREMLKRRHAKPHASAERLFSTIDGSKLVQVSKTFRRIAAEMFNEEVADPRQKVCFHSLRHTFASWHVQHGTDLYTVKELMGHSSFKMTQRYAHLAPDGLRKAVKVLED